MDCFCAPVFGAGLQKENVFRLKKRKPRHRPAPLSQRIHAAQPGPNDAARGAQRACAFYARRASAAATAPATSAAAPAPLPVAAAAPAGTEPGAGGDARMAGGTRAKRASIAGLDCGARKKAEGFAQWRKTRQDRSLWAAQIHGGKSPQNAAARVRQPQGRERGGLGGARARERTFSTLATSLAHCVVLLNGGRNGHSCGVGWPG